MGEFVLQEQLRAYGRWLQDRGQETYAMTCQIRDSYSSETNPKTEVLFLSDFAASGDLKNPLTTEEQALIDKIASAMKLEKTSYQRAAIWRSPNDLENSLDHIQALVVNINPRLIITLGEKTFDSVAPEMTRFQEKRGVILTNSKIGPYPLLGVFHPRDLLRRPEDKRLAWTDLQVGMRWLELGFKGGSR